MVPKMGHSIAFQVSNSFCDFAAIYIFVLDIRTYSKQGADLLTELLIGGTM